MISDPPCNPSPEINKILPDESDSAIPVLKLKLPEESTALSVTAVTSPELLALL